MSEEHIDFLTFQKTDLVKLKLEIKRATYDQILSCLANGDEYGLKEIMDGFNNDEKVVVWGLFNSEQRRTMREFLKI